MMELLEAIVVAGRPVSPAELASATELPRPTCYRIVQSLSDCGLLDKAGSSGAVQIGERLANLILRGSADTLINRALEPGLKQLASQYGEASFLGRLRNGRVQIVRVVAPAAGKPYIHPGLSERPWHACSCAKAVAAFGGAQMLREVMEGELNAFTDKTMVSPAALSKEFEQIRQDGYAICDQETEVGVLSLAAPIHLGARPVQFSLGIVGPITRLGHLERSQIGQVLIEVAATAAASFNLARESSEDGLRALTI